MTPNNNIMILPFYSSLLKQSRYKKEAFGNNYPLYTPINYLLPFQFSLPTGYTLNYVQWVTCGDNPYSEYNVTLEVPLISGYYTLPTAIAAVPLLERKLGLQITFATIISNVYSWVSLKYTGSTTNVGDWTNANNWTTAFTNFNTKIAAAKTADMSIVAFGDYNQFINTGLTSLAINLIGAGYLRLVFQKTGTSDLLSYYSEMFTFLGQKKDYISIEYWNDDPFYAEDKIILYPDGVNYKNKIFIQANINKPTYDFTENGTEKDGYLNIESIISKKIFNFFFPAPEYLCDAIRLIGMHDNIYLYYEEEEYIVNRLTPNPKWENSDYLAKVEVSFECNTVLKAINKPLVSSGAAFDASFDLSFDN